MPPITSTMIEAIAMIGSRRSHDTTDCASISGASPLTADPRTLTEFRSFTTPWWSRRGATLDQFALQTGCTSRPPPSSRY